jgi:hypothetical protein
LLILLRLQGVDFGLELIDFLKKLLICRVCRVGRADSHPNCTRHHDGQKPVSGQEHERFLSGGDAGSPPSAASGRHPFPAAFPGRRLWAISADRRSQ